MVSDSPALFWFRDDLRLADNPGLAAACEAGRHLILLHVLDDSGDGTRPLGGASRWWLHHSLKSLSADLAEAGQTLILRQGQARDVVPEIVRQTGARRAFWSRRYGHARALDAGIETALAKHGCETTAFAANHLFEPGTIRNADDKPFKVFSAFWRAARRRERDIRPAIERPRTIPPPFPGISGASIEYLGLLPTAPDWAGGLREAWQPGEDGAKARLMAFVDGRLADYADRRDFPAEPVTSMLSPHLRFGEIGPAQIWRTLAGNDTADKFRSELGWREFAWHVLDEAPDLATGNLVADFDRFPWAAPDKALLHAWRKGLTGYPIVDAGMRQLWQTGWMHNRVRMVVASFLTRHLLTDWRRGEEWFWDTLVDADPANNPFGWQWVAGSGFDAQPYFRIFNPVLQGKKFDPDGAYVRHYVPELAKMPDRFLHEPWAASPIELQAAGMTLGDDYPEPIVDHGQARARALAAHQAMRQGN